MVTEAELWGEEVPECHKPNNQWPCKCPVHDLVAELLDIDSTNPDGYKSTKTRERERIEKYLLPASEPVKEIPQAVLGTPAERTIDTTKGYWVQHANGEVYAEPPQGEAIYELGKAEPVAYIDANFDPILTDYLNEDEIEVRTGDDYKWVDGLAAWLPSAGGDFSLHGGVNMAMELRYTRNGYAVRRTLMNTDPSILDAAARWCIEEVDRAENEAASNKVEEKLQAEHEEYMKNLTLKAKQFGVAPKTRKPPPDPVRHTYRREMEVAEQILLLQKRYNEINGVDEYERMVYGMVGLVLVSAVTALFSVLVSGGF